MNIWYWLEGAEARAFGAGRREARRLAVGHSTLTYESEIPWPRAAAARVEVRVQERIEGWQRWSARRFAAYHRRRITHAAATAERLRAEGDAVRAQAALVAATAVELGSPFLPAVDHRLGHGWHLLLLVAITVLEWPLVYMMLQLLSIGALLTAMAAAALAVATVAICDHLGALLRRPRIPGGFWPLLTVLLAYLLAGSYLRAEYVLVAGEAGELTATGTFLTFLAIQLFLAACAVYLAQRVALPAVEAAERARRALAAAVRAEVRAAQAVAAAEQHGRLRALALQAELQAEVAAGRVCIDAYWRGLTAGWPPGVPFPSRAFYQPAMPAIPLLWPPAPLERALVPAGAAAPGEPAPNVPEPEILPGPGWRPRPAAASAHGDD